LSTVRVRVVYALPERQVSVELTLDERATVGDAVARSGLRERFPAIAPEGIKCAVFSRPVALTDPLREGDRVEILRPLSIDPKEQRRQAAAKTKKR